MFRSELAKVNVEKCPIKLSDVATSRVNNLELFARFVAALMVKSPHCYAVLGGDAGSYLFGVYW